MKWLRIGVTTAVLTLVMQTQWTGAGAVSVRECGGQDWKVQAPVTCQKKRVIAGELVTVLLHQDANGFTEIAYHLAHARKVDTLVHSTSHLGASGSGGPSRDPRDVISAGQRDIVLFIPQALCGQIDNRAIFDDSRGRVTGPWINNDTCKRVPPPIVTTTSPVTTTPVVTTTPGGSTTPTSPPGSSTSVNTVPGGGSSQLVATGSDAQLPLALSGFALVVGSGLVLVARRRPT